MFSVCVSVSVCMCAYMCMCVHVRVRVCEYYTVNIALDISGERNEYT